MPNSSDAARSSQGTICMNVICRVCSSTTAPLTPPSTEAEATTAIRSRRRSIRSAHTEVNCPGHSATVLVALAWMGRTPIASIAGKEMKEPPPAIAFITPRNK